MGHVSNVIPFPEPLPGRLDKHGNTILTPSERAKWPDWKPRATAASRKASWDGLTQWINSLPPATPENFFRKLGEPRQPTK